MLNIGDKIFYQKNNNFYMDIVKDVVIVGDDVLYELTDYDWWCVTEDELLDESDERVQDYLCMEKDGFVKLSAVRSWLQSYARNYYEDDAWSYFNDEDMIKDLCKDMLYNKNK